MGLEATGRQEVNIEMLSGAMQFDGRSRELGKRRIEALQDTRRVGVDGVRLPLPLDSLFA